MNKQPLKVLAFVAVLASGLTVSAVQASEVSDVLKAGAVKVQIAKTAQTKVDRIADQTDGLLQEFKQVNKQIESLRVYNSQLERQIASQKQMMAELKESIENATIIERGISPLMMSMLKGLEDFVALDFPLRKTCVKQPLPTSMSTWIAPSSLLLKNSARFLKSTILKSEYSQSLEAYRDLVDINADGSEVEVECSRSAVLL